MFTGFTRGNTSTLEAFIVVLLMEGNLGPKPEGGHLRKEQTYGPHNFNH